ncbi:MAG TPA: hypothetical protein VHB02_06170 [Acidimicrobiales bacterium]|nr:hypothetical protein [Acidimicrobiales bacterium]
MLSPSSDGQALLRGPRAHSIAWTIAGDTISGVVTCHAIEGADCRLNCPEGCESWDITDHEHELEDYGSCVFVEWVDQDGAQFTYGGAFHPLVNGAIEPKWNGDHYTWNYVDAQS